MEGKKMKVIVVATDPGKSVEIKGAVLEALQGDGECLMIPHSEGTEACFREQPDLVVVCDYDEVSPMARAVGFQSYCRIREIAFERNVIRMGDKPFKYPDYCHTLTSLKALVYMRHRERGGSAFVRRH